MGNDISKLPKWAQTEIEVLRKNNRYLQDKIDTMSGVAQVESNTYIVSGMDLKPLPNDTTIRFDLAGKGRVDVCVNDHGLVYINTVKRSSNTMVIVPHVSNAFSIDFK